MEPISGGLGVFGVILFIVTLVSILRSNHSGLAKFGWILVAFFLSFIGSILWFLIGRKK
jgi:hypothetical protein